MIEWKSRVPRWNTYGMYRRYVGQDRSGGLHYFHVAFDTFGNLKFKIDDADNLCNLRFNKAST
jgi:hypothetical protein